MQLVYIGLGSNLGEPVTQLQQATAAISGLPASRLQRHSSIYSSAPLGPPDQPRFANAVLALYTTLTPLALLDALQNIENCQGRVRQGERWGPRTLDLDILLFGDQLIDEPRLQVPHYHMQQRPFVLLPLAEICPPGLQLADGRKLQQLLAECPADPTLKRLENQSLLA